MEAVRVVRHESELGSWTLAERRSDERLRGLVDRFEDYEETSAPAAIRRQEPPVPVVPLIANFEASWEVADSPEGVPVRHHSFIAGLSDRTAYVSAAGPASCIQVNLTPLGAFRLLGAPMHELAGRTVELGDVLPSELAHLPERLAEAQTSETRFALLDELLLRRLARAPEPAAEVAWAWGILERTHGRAPIGWLCERIGRSRRHLAARFREQIGLTPKSAARILRFNRAVLLLRAGDATLADVAFTSGYYDQAHMNRDFRELAGTSPGAFAARIVPDAGVLV
jgi:AraC-like DNA-binding protein